ncbi:SGNH/GDSL hydrolase family protein [Kutzneria sp. NPDC051319]|uniref:SGNH/GDSL hydrolase family protein n=1 Tax=Kutzneria sp. NPDC051319 TaxID=3155047 RepID=UPI003441E22E
MLKKWLLATATAAALVLATGTAASASPAPVYLSLGDSLSVGFQPDAQGVGHPTAQGFDHDLARGLRLTELGCPAETTTSMIGGGVCAYPGAKSQLDAAVNFLTAHRNRVALITIVIGATDVENCATATGIDMACLAQGVGAIQANLPVILDRLKAAAPYAKFVGLNLYDPFLAAFLQGDAGQQLARQSVPLTQQVNGILAAAYGQHNVPVADVESAFHTTDFTPGADGIPLNVATICQDTFMCQPPPVGPNIHPDPAGYCLMAGAVLDKLVTRW